MITGIPAEILVMLDERAATLGWDQPHRLLGIKSADGMDERFKLPGTDLALAVFYEEAGHPFNALVGRELQDEFLGLVVITEGWSYPPDVIQDPEALARVTRWLAPSDHHRRIECRTVIFIGRDGQESALSHPRAGPVQVIQGPDGHLEGRLPDAMRRALGIELELPEMSSGVLLGRLWSRTVASWAAMAVQNGTAPPRWDDPAIDPLVFLAHQSPSGPTDPATFGREMIETIGWEEFHEFALAGHVPGVTPEVARWMGPALLATEMVGNFPSVLSSLSSIEALCGEDQARELESALFERGWADVETSIAREPQPVPGRNAACPCGSGSKFKYCCGS